MATAIAGACLGNTEASSCSMAAMPDISMRGTPLTRPASTGAERRMLVASRFGSGIAGARKDGFFAAPRSQFRTTRKPRSSACYLRSMKVMTDWTAAAAAAVAATQLTVTVSHRSKVMAMAAGPAFPAGEATAIAPEIPAGFGGSASAEAADAGSRFIRPHLRELAPYTPIEPFEILSARLGFDVTEIVKLDANENLYGPPPEVLQALGSMNFPNIYPDPESRRLRAALAKDVGIEMEYLLAGCGADELIDLIMRCTLDPGDKIVDCPPTFTMYAFDAAVNGVEVVQVPRLPGFQIDVEGIKKAVKEHEPKAIFLASPNNPDGSVMGDDDLLEILELPVLVILDEAYIEFAKIGTRMSWVKQFSNLIVLRTFSKRAGLAGLRVGYGAFPLGLIEYLWRAKQPYNVSVAAEIAACAALTNPSYLESVKNALVEERERLFSLLSEIPFLRPYPSHANFILCNVLGGMDAKKLKADLAAKKIMVRHYDKELLSGYIRVSVGKPEHTDALMKALWSIAERQS